MKRPKKRAFHETLREQLQGANECLDMVRETLVKLGLPMEGCPPMFYDDAIRQVASILGRRAGFIAWPQVIAAIRDHEAARVAGSGV